MSAGAQPSGNLDIVRLLGEERELRQWGCPSPTQTRGLEPSSHPGQPLLTFQGPHVMPAKGSKMLAWYSRSFPDSHKDRRTSEFWTTSTCIPISAKPYTSCVTSSKLLDFSEPWSLMCKRGQIIALALEGCFENQMRPCDAG